MIVALGGLLETLSVYIGMVISIYFWHLSF